MCVLNACYFIIISHLGVITASKKTQVLTYTTSVNIHTTKRVVLIDTIRTSAHVQTSNQVFRCNNKRIFEYL